MELCGQAITGPARPYRQTRQPPRTIVFEGRHDKAGDLVKKFFDLWTYFFWGIQKQTRIQKCTQEVSPYF